MTATIREERVVELTSALVAFDTHETEGRAQAHLASVLEKIGFECRLQEIAPGRLNLIATRGDGGPFLCSHIDVHPPHAHPDPFTARRDGDVLVGRGVLDAKGQIAALVSALEAQSDAPAVVAIMCDEEFGGHGSERVELPKGNYRDRGGIVLEPTGLAVCTAQSGHIDIKVTAGGTPGHAYAREQSGSPIAAVLAAADALETCAFLSKQHPLLPRAAIRIGRIDGGEHLWRRPARASIELAITVLPGVDIGEAMDEVRTRLHDAAGRWDARGTSFVYQIDASAGIEVPSDLPIVAALGRALGSPIEPKGMPSWTDAANLLTHHGVACVVFGAGDLASAHSDREWVPVADLVRLAEVLGRLLASSS